MGKEKRLKLWWQLYRTSLPERDVRNITPMDFCWTECTKPVPYMSNRFKNHHHQDIVSGETYIRCFFNAVTRRLQLTFLTLNCFFTLNSYRTENTDCLNYDINRDEGSQTYVLLQVTCLLLTSEFNPNWNVTICCINPKYGLLNQTEYSQWGGYTPIVQLSQKYNTNDWITVLELKICYVTSPRHTLYVAHLFYKRQFYNNSLYQHNVLTGYKRYCF